MTTKKYEITYYNCALNKYESIEVTKEVYEEYRRGEWRMTKENQKYLKNEIPFSALIGSQENLENFNEFMFEETFNQEDIESERIKLAKQALSILSDTMRERYISHYYVGLTTKEIAERDGVSEYSIKDSLKLAQKKINKFLKKFQK